MYILKDFLMGTSKQFKSFEELRSYMPQIKANSYTAFRSELKSLFGNDIQVNKI